MIFVLEVKISRFGILGSESQLGITSTNWIPGDDGKATSE
jgi:hypothetical protein